MNQPTSSASEVLAFSIAGIRIHLTASAHDVRLIATPARGIFSCSPRAPADIDVSVDWLSDQTDPADDVEKGGAELAFDSGQLWRLYREPRGGWTFHFASNRFGARPYKVARFSATFDRGSILVDRRAAYGGDVDPLEYPLDELLWIHWLATRGSVELHACGVVETGGTVADEDGRAGYAFVGQSGAGKTTTAQLWAKDPGFEILTDDRTIVRRHDREFRLHGTPWHGEGRFARPGSARLRGTFLLVQARRTEIRAISPAIALARLMAASFPPFHDAASLAATTETMAALVENTPCFELRFTPDASVVEVVVDHFRRVSHFGPRQLPAAPDISVGSLRELVE
jgi:hypothetical protein